MAVVLGMGTGLSRADNSCVESGPHTNVISCIQSGTFVPGVLTPTNISAVVGQAIVLPTAYGYSITNGKEYCHITNDCPSTGPNYYSTNPIPYTFGSVYFVPAIPSVFWRPGIYTYTGMVLATGSPCSPLTNNLGTVTVSVNSNNPDVLLDVDFGGAVHGSKTGYAAIGDSPNDLWNYYIAGGYVVTGAVANLVTVEGIVSPVGLLVNKLPTPGANGSSDAMYNDYLSTNGGVATLTLTNLPTGTWNVYLYANDGNFDLKVGGNDYGTQTCYDSSPGSTPLAWQQGVQYVAFQNVAVTNGQSLTITINPGTNGAAMISGLQIGSVTHTPSPLASAPSGIVSWWRAEGNALDSIGTNNGALVGGAGYAAGEVGQAFSLNGTNGYVAIPDSPSLDAFATKITIELWLKANSLSANPDWVWIVTKGNSSWELQCTSGAKTITFNASGTSNVSLTGSRNVNDGQWHHVAGVYDGTHMFLYVDGTLDVSQPTTGAIAQNSYPVYIGQNAEAPRVPFNGLIDEVSLYNRALSSSEIAAIYNAGSNGKITSLMQDSDYDGVSDLQELADRTNPDDPNSVLHIRLGYWPFDDTNAWVGAEGQLPLQATNVVGIPSWDTNAVLIDSTNPAILKYRDVETNGNANINLRSGTVRFWFKPDWSSVDQGGTGPGSYGRLIEMGNCSPYLPTNSYVVYFTNGWWGLYFNTNGTQLTFASSTNGFGGIHLTSSVSLTSNLWYQMALTYTPTKSLLYLNGQVITNGLGSINYPNEAERANGFRIGSDSTGNNQARGAFDDLETFDYPLAAGDIETNYQAAINLDSDGDGISNIIENELGLNPYGYNCPNGLNAANGLQVFTPLK